MNSVIAEVLRTGIVKNQHGTDYPLQANVDDCEGKVLLELIGSDPSIRKTLEIGCAYGLSSLYICSALCGRNSPKHVIVDPFQHEQWQGIGVLNLQRAGFNFFELIEERSEFALPEIARRESGTFDLVFIDGWHTFDHTLLDLFYANRLVRVGGYIVVDDCTWSPVGKAVSYFRHYPSYRISHQSQPSTNWKRAIKKTIRTLLPSAVGQFVVPHHFYDRYYVRTLFSSMVALQKISEDERNYDWFRPF